MLRNASIASIEKISVWTLTCENDGRSIFNK